MVYKAENVDSIVIDGETYPVDGFSDLPISPEEAAAHGMVLATAEEAAAFLETVSKGRKGKSDDGSK